MNKRGRFLVALLLWGLLSAPPGTALDFGLVIEQSPEFANTKNDDAELNYTGSYSPWFSAELGRTVKLYLQATISTVYEAGEWTPVLFEVGRSQVSWRPEFSGSSIHIEAGRLPFQDPLHIIASGLFDGISGSAVLGQARLRIGAFFTGLLYKETADIVMTPSDTEVYIDKDSYFASRRLLFSGGVELPALTSRSSLAANLLLQFDVNNNASSLHTQYFSLKYIFLPLETLSLTGAAAAGLAENQDGDTSAQFAFAAGAEWEVPGALRDMLQGEIRWTNGAFTPVTGIPQGQVFSPTLSGLMTVNAKYTIRFHDDFSAQAEGTYFIRTDGETLSGSDFPASSDRFLGGELYGSLSWAPASDLMAVMGCGFFFPGLGNVFVPDAPIRWKIRAALILSL